MSSPSLEDFVTRTLGAERLKGDAEADALAPHPKPRVVVRPETRDELRELLSAAHRDRIPCVPLGGNHEPRLPEPGAPPALLVSTLGLNRLVAHDRDDLCFTAETGMRLGAAQEIVASASQLVPFLPPGGEARTLGGIIACAADGPAVPSFGNVRDQVLGLEIVHGDGRLTKAGGRVVKNVSGYDRCRLYAGSRGALGILVSVSLRLRPLFARATALVLPDLDLEDALRRGFDVRDRFPELAGLHLARGACLSGLREAREKWDLVISLRGLDALVETLCAEIRELCGPSLLEVPGDSLPRLADPFGADARYWEAACLPSKLGEVANLLDPESSGAQVLDLLRGVVASTPGAEEEGDGEQRLATALQELPIALRLVGDPGFHGRRHRLFPKTRPGGVEMMERLRERLDPHGILNPGRSDLDEHS